MWGRGNNTFPHLVDINDYFQKMIKKVISSLVLLLSVQLLAAQIPAGYYGKTTGKSGRELKTAMHNAIKNHAECSYGSLMDHFKKTDRRADGKVWDMYSATTNYSFGGKTARYSGEGAGFNREHSFPKSWFGGKIGPMYTDLFHIYPTDGYINNRRWHYAFGENNGEVYSSEKNWSKLGVSTTPGCSEVVFEPNDEYKGDFARTYFYMATCYEDKIAGWKTLNGKADGEKVPMLNQTSYPCFEKWALDMLLRWAKQDPVSQKEIDRNNAVYEIQHNRNPFIDYPGLEQYVWGDSVNVPFDPNDFDANGGGEVNPQPDDKYVAAPTFSVYSGEVAKGTEVVISCTDAEATICYSVNNAAEQSSTTAVTIVVDEDMQVTAYAKKGELVSDKVSATYYLSAPPVVGDGAYVKVSDEAELTVGHRYLIVCEDKNVALSAHDSDIRSYADVVIKAYSIDTEVSAQGLPYALTLGKDAAGYTLFDAADNLYLALTSNNNKLHSIADKDMDEAHWTIDVAASGTNISNVAYPKRSIKYNAQAPRFATYTNGQCAVTLYKETVADAIDCIVNENGKVDVYDINGRLLRQQVTKAQALRGLPHGAYIMGGTKVFVR